MQDDCDDELEAIESSSSDDSKFVGSKSSRGLMKRRASGKLASTSDLREVFFPLPKIPQHPLASFKCRALEAMLQLLTAS